MTKTSTTTDRRLLLRRRLYRLTATGILIALAMVTKLATGFSIPILGPGGMKVGFSGIFTALPAFLFGPIYGGIASALSDMIGAFVKPDGAYIPWLTVTAFLGGCIKGLLWQLLVKAHGKKGGAVFLSIFLLVGIFGIGNHLALRADGIVSSLITTKQSVPTKDVISEKALSPLSSLATKLATYQNDTLTVTTVPSGEIVTIPASATTASGFAFSVKKIGANAFADCPQPLTVILPSTITSIDASAFGDLTDVTILSPENSIVADYCTSRGFTYTVTATENSSCNIPNGGDPVGDGYTFKSSDTYRKYLSGYLNFMTFGLILISIVGIITSLLFLLFSKKPTVLLLMRCATACILSGVFVTTVNTEILRHFLSAYQGRAFMILLIPRIIEEIVVCLLQSYLIFLLLGIYETRIKPRIAAAKQIQAK